MDSEKRNFKLTDENRKNIQSRINRYIKKSYREDVPSYIENYDDKKFMVYRYNVSMFDGQIKFVTYMSDEELSVICKYAMDIVEELMVVNNCGTTKEKYKLIYDRERIKEAEYSILREIWEQLKTERLERIMVKASESRGINELSAYTISLPYLRSIIMNMYEKIVDRFDDEDYIFFVGTYIARGIMRMGEE